MKPSTAVSSMLRLLLLPLLLLSTAVSQADDRVFALVPKQLNSEFFELSRRGCLDAAEIVGVRCLFRGASSTDFRDQDRIINELIDQGIDGLAVSVVRSAYLASHSIARAQSLGIPVVTFDADFAAAELSLRPLLRLAYIGTDNHALGRALGQQLRALKPEGGRLCVLAGHRDSDNLQQRIDGIRTSLGGSAQPVGQPLAGAGGWTEHPRCPLFSADDPEKALNQLLFMLKEAEQRPESIDALVSIGYWAQMSPRYVEGIAEFGDLLDRRGVVLLMTDTLNLQLDYLSRGLAHGNVGQDPYQMGYQAIETLQRIVSGKRYPALIHTPLIYCTGDNVDHCNKVMAAD